MKFIVDAQLPKSLSIFFIDQGFDSIHTLDLPDKNKTKDNKILTFARKENRIIITKDLDFLKTYLLKGDPKKLILVKTGNIDNKHLLKIFKDNLTIILELIGRSNLIEISKTEIAEHGNTE